MAGTDFLSGILEMLGKVMTGYGSAELSTSLENRKKPEEIKLWEATHPGGEKPSWEELKAYKQSALSYLPYLGSILGGATGNASGGTSNQIGGQPKIGDVVEGFRFLGGDPSKPENWELMR